MLYKTGLQLSEEKNKKTRDVIRFSFILEDKTIHRQGRDKSAKKKKERVGIADSVRFSIPAKQGHLSGSTR